MNLNRVIYSICYDMLEQPLDAYKIKEELAISCPRNALVALA